MYFYMHKCSKLYLKYSYIFRECYAQGSNCIELVKYIKVELEDYI